MPGVTRTYGLNIAAGLILLSAAALARAEDQNPTPRQTPPLLSEQAIYKGVVGNLLEEVPIDPDRRVQLQRGNAVVSNALSGRSLATFIGMASPPLMLAGLLWGLFAAAQIGPPSASVTHSKDNEALDKLVAKDAVQTSIAISGTTERNDSLCSNSAAAECERLADLMESLPAKRFSGRYADQARREAAHAQLGSGLTDLREISLLEVVLEQPSTR